MDETALAPDKIEAWLLDEESQIIDLLSAGSYPETFSVTKPVTTDNIGTALNILTAEIDEWAGLHLSSLGIATSDPPASYDAVHGSVTRALAKSPLAFGAMGDNAPRLWMAFAKQEFLQRSAGTSDRAAAGEVATAFCLEVGSDPLTAIQSVWLADVEPMDVTVGELSLRPLSDEERASFHRIPATDEIRMHWSTHYAAPVVALERRIGVPRSAPAADATEFDNVLVALMLSDVRFKVLGRCITKVGRFAPLGYSFGPDVSVDWQGKRDADGAALRDALDLIPVLAERKNVARAGRRILWSTLRTGLDDQIVDLVVALEGLLTTDGAGLSFQFRVHGALRVEEDPDARRAVVKELKDAYNERSILVHQNNKTEWSNDRVEGLRQRANQICRTFVTDQFPDDLTDVILSMRRQERTDKR